MIRVELIVDGENAGFAFYEQMPQIGWRLPYRGGTCEVSAVQLRAGATPPLVICSTGKPILCYSTDVPE